MNAHLKGLKQKKRDGEWDGPSTQRHSRRGWLINTDDKNNALYVKTPLGPAARFGRPLKAAIRRGGWIS